MSPALRVDEQVKAELDRLQGEILAEKGERLSHSEVLARLLHYVRRREDEFLHGADRRGRPSREDVRRWASRLPQVDVAHRAREVDEALYGERP